MNWDTDGDWMNDWFEVRDDEEDGVREAILHQFGTIPARQATKTKH